MIPTISLQNQSPYAKALAVQESGQMPLYLGPSRYGKASSADLSVVQFLAYYGDIERFCTRKDAINGQCALYVISDRGIAQVAAADLLQGIVSGHFGEDSKALALAFISARDAAVSAKEAWNREEQAIRQGSLARAQV